MGQRISLKRNFKLNSNQKITCQNLQDAAKAVLTGKFTAFNGCIGKEKKI